MTQSADSNVQSRHGLSLSLPLQMLAGLIGGIALSLLWPSFATKLQPLGTAFIAAVRMVVIPLIFAAVTLGIYRLGTGLRQLGRVAVVAFVWFYIATILL